MEEDKTEKIPTLTDLPKEILLQITSNFSPHTKSRLVQTEKALSGLSVFPDTPQYRKIQDNIPNLTQLFSSGEKKDHSFEDITTGNNWSTLIFGLNSLGKVIVSAAHLGSSEIMMTLIKDNWNEKFNPILNGERYPIEFVAAIAAVEGDRPKTIIAITHEDSPTCLSESMTKQFVNLALYHSLRSKNGRMMVYLISYFVQDQILTHLDLIDWIFEYDVDNLHFYLNIIYSVNSNIQLVYYHIYNRLVDLIVKYDRIDLAKQYFIDDVTYDQTWGNPVSEDKHREKLKSVLTSKNASVQISQYIEFVLGQTWYDPISDAADEILQIMSSKRKVNGDHI